MSKQYENLLFQLDKLCRRNRQGSFKTRERYYEAIKRFCRFLAERYRLERLANIAPKHIFAYVYALRESGKAASTIKTELSAIRFFHDLIPNPRFELPDNSQLLLRRRTLGGVDRTWSIPEFKRMLACALSAEREDYITILYLGRYAALRIHECFRIDTSIAAKALKENALTIKGKGGLVRTVPLNDILLERLRLHLEDTPRGHKLFVPNDRLTYEAIKDFQRFLADHRPLAQAPDSDRPFLPFMEQWLNKVEGYSICVTTLEQCKAVFRNVISTFPAFQNVTLRGLAPGHIQSFYNSEIKRGVSPSTVRKYHTDIHKCLNYAMQLDIIDRNPADRIVSPKKQHKAQKTIYSAEEIKRLMEFFQGDILETVIRLTATYGLRRSEVCGLRWESVDFEKGTIAICHTAVSSKNGVIYADATKTRSSCRTLPLTASMAEYLRGVQKRQQKEKTFLGAAYVDSRYVCVGPDGTPLTPNAVSMHVRRMIRKSGLPYIRFHRLRHPNVKPKIKNICYTFVNVDASFPLTNGLLDM